MTIDVTNELMIQCQVPNDRADWETVMRFALTVDGYRALGQERLADLANACRGGGQLAEDLTELRACLFCEQRRWRHFGEAPDSKGMRHIPSLVRAIRRQVAAAQSSRRHRTRG